MKTVTLTIRARTRRLGVTKALVRIAALLHSMRLARWAVRLAVCEYRTEPGKRWTRIPLDIKVTHTEDA